MRQRPRLRRVLPLVGLTFGLTWGLELVVARTIGQRAYPGTGPHPMGMLYPAFTALLLRMFAFSDSPLHFRTLAGPVRWVVYSFLLLTVANTAIGLLAPATAASPAILRGAGAALVALWTLVVFLLTQAVLNLLLGLGKFPGVLAAVGGVPVPAGLYPFALVAFLAITVVGTPLSGLAALFGEEYAWRGVLQVEMVRLGPGRGSSSWA